MSFVDEVFDFDKNIGMNLICGKNNDIPGSRNGTGKSALLSALVYTLYGRTSSNIKNCNIWNKYVDDKPEMRVVAYFNVDDNSYKVVSGFNKHYAPYCHFFEVTDGEEHDITKSTILETRKFIANEILHCDIDVFLRTILLSSDQNYNFFRLSKYEKKQFIEKLFDIQVFGEIYNSLHRKVLDSDKEMLSKQNRLLVLNNNASNYKERIEKFEYEKKSKINALNENMAKLVSMQNKLKDSVVAVNTEEVEKYSGIANELNSKLDSISIKLSQLNQTNCKIDVAMHKLQSSKEHKNKVITKHKEVLDKLCVECKKVFSDYYSLDTYAKDIAEIELKLSKLQANKDSNCQAAILLNAKNDELDKKLATVKKKMKLLTEEATKTNTMLMQTEAKIIALKNEIDSNERQQNPYAELYDNNSIELQNENAALEKLQEDYKYLKFAENIVSQDTLRKIIIGDLIWLLNNKLKMYLTKFGAKYDVEFDADMNYKFTTSAGEYEYDSFSAGERARIMIAACFAFRDFMYIRNNFSSNILILDEFIDGAIDSLAIDSILTLLEDFSKLYNQNIFVISHRKEIENDRFDHIIQIVKTNNISKITYLE